MAKQHIKLAIGVVVIVSAVGYLISSGVTGSTVYFLTVPEIQQRSATLQGEPIRVAGKVTDDPVQWDVRTLSLRFVLGEGDARVPVQYTGVKPDLFQVGAPVIVEGQIGRDGILTASNLLTQCPSKYEAEKRPNS